jgi:hypothetical protein
VRVRAGVRWFPVIRPPGEPGYFACSLPGGDHHAVRGEPGDLGENRSAWDRASSQPVIPAPPTRAEPPGGTPRLRSVRYPSPTPFATLLLVLLRAVLLGRHRLALGTLALRWRRSRRRRPGRPGCPAIGYERMVLIERTQRENPLRGAPRITSALRRLGHHIGHSTVSRYMQEARDPAGAQRCPPHPIAPPQAAPRA